MASYRIWGDRAEKIVILDSSAILMLFEFSIDLEDEIVRLLGRCHIVVPRPILDELKVLSEKGKGKAKVFAKPALVFVKRFEIMDIEGFRGDDAVLHLAKKVSGVVVTNDTELKQRIKKAGLHVVFLRGKQKLVLD